MKKHSKKGLIKTLYRAQKQNSKKRGHRPPEYTYDEFHNYVTHHKDFENLYNDWCLSGYKTNKRPSVDRLDNTKGYSFNNVQLVTWEINDMLGKESTMKEISKFSLEGEFIASYKSISQAARENNMENKHISAVAKGKRSLTNGFIWLYTKNVNQKNIEEAVRNAKITLSGIPKKCYRDYCERAVVLYDLDGNIYKEYKSLVDVGEDNVVRNAELPRMMYKKHLINSKYLFYYKDDFSKETLIKDIMSKRKNHIQYKGMVFKTNLELRKYLFKHEGLDVAQTTLRNWCLDKDNAKFKFYSIKNIKD